MSDESPIKSSSAVVLSFDASDEALSSEIERDSSSALELSCHEDTEPQKEIGEMPLLTIEDYRSRYLKPTRIKEKTAFTVNVETLEILRNVLQDLRERVSMGSYIENILREHLRSHRELLNQATAKQRRKTTIPL